MANRALRELRSLPLFQWEASARSSDFPARGELLNMPTYDADMFSRRTRRLRSQVEGCNQGHAQPTAQPPKSKAPASARKRIQPASKAKRRKKNLTNSAVPSISEGKENASTGEMLPVRNCLGPVTPGVVTPSDAAKSVPFCPETDPRTGSQAVTDRRLFPEATKVCTPQNKKQVDQSLSLEITSTPSSLTPMLNTPSVPGSCRPGISSCSTLSAKLQPNKLRISHSHDDVTRVAVTPPAVSTIRPESGLMDHETCVSTRDNGAPGCAAHPLSDPSHRVLMSPYKACKGAEQAQCTTSANETPRRTSMASESPREAPQSSPFPSGNAHESEVAPACSDKGVGLAESVSGAAQEDRDVIVPQQGCATNSERITVAQLDFEAPMQQPSVVNDAVSVPVSPPCTSQAVQQSNPLDLLASVAAGFTPADDKDPTDVAAALTSLVASGCAEATADAALGCSPTTVPGFKASADAVSDISPANGSPLSLLVSALTAQCNPNPEAAVEHPHSRHKAVQGADIAAPTSQVPTHPGVSACAASVDDTRSTQLSDPLQSCAYECVNAAPPSPRMTTRSKSGGSDVHQVAAKRPRSDTNPASSPKETVKVPVEKKTKFSTLETVSEQPCDADATLQASVSPSVLSLFKPSKKLDLFAPSPTLEPGSAWIVTWLP